MRHSLHCIYLSVMNPPPQTHTHTLEGNSVSTNQTQHKPTPAASHSWDDTVGAFHRGSSTINNADISELLIMHAWVLQLILHSDAAGPRRWISGWTHSYNTCSAELFFCVRMWNQSFPHSPACFCCPADFRLYAKTFVWTWRQPHCSPSSVSLAMWNSSFVVSNCFTAKAKQWAILHEQCNIIRRGASFSYFWQPSVQAQWQRA